MGQRPTANEKMLGTLIELLEGGCIPWRPLGRKKAMAGRHLNLFTGHPYGGADPLLLDVAMVKRDSPFPWWSTFGAAKAAGLSPRRGAEGVQLGLSETLFEARTQREIVFNVADLVGPSLQRTLKKRRENLVTNAGSAQHRLRLAERQLRAWSVPVWQGAHLPRYDPSRDLIMLPTRQSFHCKEAFLARWALEQIHSTWHPQRWGYGLMDQDQLDHRTWSEEEFVSELTWILLADRLGLRRDYGVFVLAEADWIERVQQTPQTFIHLLADARRAADLLTANGARMIGSADKAKALV